MLSWSLLSASTHPPLAVGLGICVVIALLAWQAGALSGSGAMAATAVGTAALNAGWSWGLFLVAWFVVASLLSRLKQPGTGRQAPRSANKHHTRQSRRSAWQVLANGGAYLVLALVFPFFPTQADLLATLAAASLVAAGADTTATEVGTRWGGAPYSLRLGRRSEKGLSGSVTLAGSMALVLGAVIFALLAGATGLVRLEPRVMLILVAAGIIGSAVDTVLGAFLQERRVCLKCGKQTELERHDCGGATRADGGLSWMTNDTVNLLCTLSAVIAAVIPAILYT